MSDSVEVARLKQAIRDSQCTTEVQVRLLKLLAVVRMEEALRALRNSPGTIYVHENPK